MWIDTCGAKAVLILGFSINAQLLCKNIRNNKAVVVSDEGQDNSTAELLLKYETSDLILVLTALVSEHSSCVLIKYECPLHGQTRKHFDRKSRELGTGSARLHFLMFSGDSRLQLSFYSLWFSPTIHLVHRYYD